MTVDEVIAELPRTAFNPLPAPEYSGPKPNGPHVGLAVPSMRLHTTDEGWQLFLGLESAGYLLQGYGHPFSRQHIPQILLDLDPSVLFIQDRREWEGRTAGPGFDQRERYIGVSALKGCHQVFKVTVVKDSQHEPAFHFQAAEEMAIHAWVVYYHPRIVCHLAPYLRPQHLIRTYHSVDSSIIPPFDKYQREGCLVSGAVSSAYPFRKRVFNLALNGDLPGCEILKHPGYGRSKCYTPEYLDTLSNFKVAFCDSSRYGYALRKIIEATACGCRVLTDLPVDEVLPEIDSNLIRIHPDTGLKDIANILRWMYSSYDPSSQEVLAAKAKAFYDYKAVCSRLALDIEAMRRSYNG